MNISNFKRVKKLLQSLWSNKDLVFPYLRCLPLWGKYPVDLNLPWWSFRSIEAVDKIVAGKAIFEYGSGGSTIRFSERAKSVHCVEDNEQWKNILEDRLKKSNRKNVSIQLEPFDFRTPSNFENSKYLHAIDGLNPDIVIIDGQDETFAERITCFKHVEKIIKSGGIIILDDFWRYTEVLSYTKAKNFSIYESVGPYRIGVTSTAIFQY